MGVPVTHDHVSVVNIRDGIGDRKRIAPEPKFWSAHWSAPQFKPASMAPRNSISPQIPCVVASILQIERAAINAAAGQNLALARVVGGADHPFLFHALDQ